MSRNISTRRLSQVLLLTIVLTSCTTAGYAGTPDQVSIQTLLAQAPSYDLHMVTLQGVTRDLQVLPRIFIGKCGLSNGQATFTLDDGTDSLLVEVLGNCSPQALNTLPKDGDVVRMTATIHLLNTDLPVRVQAVAGAIQILDLK